MMRTMLESASLEPMSVRDARAAMIRARVTPCEQPACVSEMLRTLEAVMGAGVAIWPHEEGIQVAVMLVDPEGRHASGSRELPLGAPGVNDGFCAPGPLCTVECSSYIDCPCTDISCTSQYDCVAGACSISRRCDRTMMSVVCG